MISQLHGKQSPSTAGVLACRSEGVLSAGYGGASIMQDVSLLYVPDGALTAWWPNAVV